MISVRSGGLVKREAYYGNKMRVEVWENYGQLKVTEEGSGKALGGVYVKVYGRRGEGEGGSFYKDGYTDLRGRMDFVTRNEGYEGVDRLSVLVLSGTHGAEIREVRPPMSG
eukprot:TRINITY_DN3427_c0_g2_i1.p1 TRINITY_DN3427_c0_g2~~TRINITY_DN3427_c0_g2_i1.p1  ORF type:complete len:123 (+),score=60.00 TRINITY_DN3427_c0_g2_i1:38-370(+)